MFACIVTGGDKPAFKKIAEFFDKSYKIVACDSGFDYLYKNNIRPDFVIGDFDSSKNTDIISNLPQNTVFRYPKDKDFTDTKIALDFCIQSNFENLILIGGMSERIDHFLSNYYDISTLNKNLLWIGKYQIIQVIKSDFLIKTKINETISFFSANQNTKVSKCKGLKWSLEGVDFSTLQSVSNICLKRNIELDVSGVLFCLRSIKSLKYYL